MGDQINANGVFYVSPDLHPVWCWDDSHQGSQNWFRKPLATSQWAQLVVVLEPNYQATYYVDGKLDTAKFNVGRPTNSSACTSTWSIARENRFGYYLACSISIVRQYDRALSRTEILRNYNAQKSRLSL